MTHHQSLTQLATSATVRPVLMRTQLLISIAQMFREQSYTLHYRHLVEVENMDEERVRAIKTASTPFAAVEKHLAGLGYPIDGTVGSIMDTVELSKDDVHDIACYCHTTQTFVNAWALSARFHSLATTKKF